MRENARGERQNDGNDNQSDHPKELPVDLPLEPLEMGLEARQAIVNLLIGSVEAGHLCFEIAYAASSVLAAMILPPPFYHDVDRVALGSSALDHARRNASTIVEVKR
jgi:hypothetical protein